MRLPLHWNLTILGLLLAVGIAIWQAVAFADRPVETVPDGQAETPVKRVPPVQPAAISPVVAPPSAPAIGSHQPVIDPFTADAEVAYFAPVEEVAPAPKSPLTPEAIEEILRLRRAIAGGSASQAAGPAGTGFASDEQFREALRQLTGAPAKTSQPVDPSMLPTDRGLDEARLPDSTNDLPVPHDSERSTLPDVSTDLAADFAIVASLRDTSRMLDNRAHDLDSERRFDESEELRRLATRLRRDARRIESAAVARNGSVVPVH